LQFGEVCSSVLSLAHKPRKKKQKKKKKKKKKKKRGIERDLHGGQAFSRSRHLW
jgi:hypothetical protein